MIKVIASDLDGTLLDDNHEISEVNLKAVMFAVEQGIRFIISTGRRFSDTLTVLKNHKIHCDYIVGSGAEISVTMIILL